MNMKKKLLAIVTVFALALSLAACGNGADAPEEGRQNPVMNFVGVYHSGDSTEASVEADGMEGAKITVTCAESPWFHTQTVMTGAVDADTGELAFSDAVRTEYTYGSDGNVTEEKNVYENGAGRAVFSIEDNTMTLTETFDTGDAETVFEWGAAPDMKTVTDPDHYAPVTAMDKFTVETVVAFTVRTAYLEQDWNTLSGMIRYPITVNGTELADADAFLGYMVGRTVAESDREAMMEENLFDMAVNGEGIMMGSGQIWLNDPNYMTDEEPVLQIIAISGIEGSGEDGTADGGDTAAAGLRDGDRFEATVILEGMEETVQYEHAVSEAVGFEMDFDFERFYRQTEDGRELFLSLYDGQGTPTNYVEVLRVDFDVPTTAALLTEGLQEEYETIAQESCTLAAAGECQRLNASGAREGAAPEGSLVTIYVIPAGEGSILATVRCTYETAEGFGARMNSMLNTLSVLAG